MVTDQPDRRYEELKTRLAEVHDLAKVGSLLGWDRQTMMPAGGAAVRAEHSATVARLAHERFVAEDVSRLLDELRPYEERLPYDSDEASLIRVARRDYEKARRVPPALQAELTRAAAQAFPVWVEARKAADF